MATRGKNNKNNNRNYNYIIEEEQKKNNFVDVVSPTRPRNEGPAMKVVPLL